VEAISVEAVDEIAASTSLPLMTTQLSDPELFSDFNPCLGSLWNFFNEIISSRRGSAAHKNAHVSQVYSRWRA